MNVILAEEVVSPEARSPKYGLKKCQDIASRKDAFSEPFMVVSSLSEVS